MQFLDDMKLGKKLIGGFLLITAILVIISLFAYVQISAIDQSARQVAGSGAAGQIDAVAGSAVAGLFVLTIIAIIIAVLLAIYLSRSIT